MAVGSGKKRWVWDRFQRKKRTCWQNRFKRIKEWDESKTPLRSPVWETRRAVEGEEDFPCRGSVGPEELINKTPKTFTLPSRAQRCPEAGNSSRGREPCCLTMGTRLMKITTFVQSFLSGHFKVIRICTSSDPQNNHSKYHYPHFADEKNWATERLNNLL